MVSSYHGKTYVAYLDVSGFGEIMEDLDSARSVLNEFYTTIFNLCTNANTSPGISVLVAYDSAVIFTRNQKRVDLVNGLSSILDFVKQANRHFISGSRSQPFMTTCSIAYGEFDYEDLPEANDMRKNYIFGRPYLNAVLDQKKGKPRLKAGECRLLTRNMPRLGRFRNHSLFSYVLKRGNHRYFYWMLNNRDYQHNFDKDYLDAYKSRKKDNYSKVVQVLQRYVDYDIQSR